MASSSNSRSRASPSYQPRNRTTPARRWVKPLWAAPLSGLSSSVIYRSFRASWRHYRPYLLSRRPIRPQAPRPPGLRLGFNDWTEWIEANACARPHTVRTRPRSNGPTIDRSVSDDADEGLVRELRINNENAPSRPFNRTITALIPRSLGRRHGSWRRTMVFDLSPDLGGREMWAIWRCVPDRRYASLLRRQWMLKIRTALWWRSSAKTSSATGIASVHALLIPTSGIQVKLIRPATGLAGTPA